MKMKKNMIFSGAMSMMTALLLCTACSSDDVTTDKATAAVPEGKVIHYTATVGEGDETRATLNSEKKYEFQTGDKLVITGTDISGDLTLTGDPGTTATFEGDLTYTGSGTPADELELKAVLVSTNNAMTTLTYDAAEYPTGAIASTLADAVQKYSHFTATSTYAAKDFKVSQQTAFLNFTVTFEDGTAANTNFNITIKNGGSPVRTGSVTTATDANSKVVAQFVAAMPNGTTMSGATVQLGSKDAISFGGTTTLVANKIYNIKKTVAPSAPEGAISGKFSVSSTKKVYFSKGNLQATTTDLGTSWTWAFAANQWDYIGGRSNGGSQTTTGNNFINGNGTVSANGTVDLFGWSTSATTYGMNTSTSSGTYSGDFVDWGATMGTDWFTLSSDEWTYLFNNRSASTVGGTSNGRYAKAFVNDVRGVILFPDTYTHPNGVATPTGVNATGNTGLTGNDYSSADWAKMESAGCVFLPAAGDRNGWWANNAGSAGCYWSSSPDGGYFALRVYFNSSSLTLADSSARYWGYSVRLVRDVE